MRIYLDICCFNRPFDEQAQLLVRLQTEAKLHVQAMIREGLLELVWSAMMDLENAANPDIERRSAVAGWAGLAGVDVIPDERIEALAETFVKLGVKAMDALHVACATEAHAEYFLTTDKALLRKFASAQHIKVVDPIDFVRNMDGEQHENG